LLIESQMDALTQVDERSPRLAASRCQHAECLRRNYIDLGDLPQARTRAINVSPSRVRCRTTEGLCPMPPRVLARCLERLGDALARALARLRGNRAL